MKSWLEINTFYRGIAQAINECAGEAVLVTTKQQRFATALVRHAGITNDSMPDNQVYGLGMYKSKSDVIADRMKNGGYETAHYWAKESPYSVLAGVVSEMDGCAKHLSKLYYTLNSSSTSSETIGEMNIAPSLLTFRETFKFVSTFYRTPSYFLCYTFPIRSPCISSTSWVLVHRSIHGEI